MLTATKTHTDVLYMNICMQRCIWRIEVLADFQFTMGFIC